MKKKLYVCSKYSTAGRITVPQQYLGLQVSNEIDHISLRHGQYASVSVWPLSHVPL